MTVKEFSDLCHSKIKVMSGYNGKVLCKAFKPKKHTEIGEREIVTVWCEIEATKPSGYYNIALPVMCVYVHGAKECAEANKK